MSTVGRDPLRTMPAKKRRTETMDMTTKKTTALIAAVGIALGGAAQAADDAAWLLRVGGHTVNPKSENHAVVNVNSATMLTFNLTRMFDAHWGVEILAALPFEHEVFLNTGGKVAEVKHLPPTLSVQY